MIEQEQQDSLPIEIDVHTAKSILESGEDACLVDVREPVEVHTCSLAGSVHMPMMQLPMLMRTLPKNKPVLVLCHHGQRSLRAAQFLRAYGWGTAQSIRGGINAWSIEIDPTIPRY